MRRQTSFFHCKTVSSNDCWRSPVKEYSRRAKNLKRGFSPKIKTFSSPLIHLLKRKISYSCCLDAHVVLRCLCHFLKHHVRDRRRMMGRNQAYFPWVYFSSLVVPIGSFLARIGIDYLYWLRFSTFLEVNNWKFKISWRVLKQQIRIRTELRKKLPRFADERLLTTCTECLTRLW